MARTRLTDTEVEARLREREGWTRDGDAIRRTWRFKDYAHTVLFFNAVAHLAEAQDHHPDALVGYGALTLTLTTHDAGGITDADFRLADAVDALPAGAAAKDA